MVSPSSQNANVFAQSSQKGNQQLDGKKKKGKKGEGNQNKPKPTNNANGGKKEKKVKFPCKLCQEDHLTHQCPLIDQAQKLLKSQQQEGYFSPRTKFCFSFKCSRGQPKYT